MKKNILILILLVLPISLFAQFKWEEITNIEPGYTQNVWLEVYFLPSNPNYGWICGFNGLTLRTTDGGDSWYGSATYGYGQLESIFFVNELVGFTSGGNEIYKSTDGGLTWRNITPLSGNGGIWGNFFLDENIGVVIGNGCGYEPQSYFKTTDGGDTWTQFQYFYNESGLTDAILYPNGSGFASGSGNIFKTNDYGSTWSHFARSGNNDWQEDLSIFGSTMLVPYSGGCAGGFPLDVAGARISKDSGRTWRETNFGQPMFGTFLQSKDRGWCVGWDGAIYYTSNAGDSWALTNCGAEGKQFDDIWFVNDTLGFVVGQGVFRSQKINELKPFLNVKDDISVCEGENIFLEVKGNFNSYSWSNGANTKRIYPKTSGKYYCIVANSKCEMGSTDTIEVTFNPKPDLVLFVMPNNVACEGDTLELSVNEPYTEINWQNTGENTQKIKVTKSGLYKVTVKNEFGCESNSEVQVTFNPSPKPNILSFSNSFCYGDSILLSADKDYSNYFWSKDGSQIASGTKTIIVKEGGIYRLTAYLGDCDGVSDEMNINQIADSNRLSISYIGSDQHHYKFDSTYFMDLNCKYIRLANKSVSDSFVIKNVLLAQNIDFSIPPSQLPIKLLPSSYFDLEVCFSPKVLKQALDTLFLSDNCAPHYVILEGYGKSNIYMAPSDCDADVALKTIKLDKNWYSLGAGKWLGNIYSINYSALYLNKMSANASLFNVMGSEYKNIQVESLSSSESSDGVKESGIINVDFTNLSNGLYFLVINLPYGSLVEKISVLR